MSGIFKENGAYHVLSTTPTSTMSAPKKVVTIGVNNSAEFVVHALAKNKIISAPVLDDTDVRTPLAFIDLLSVLKYIVSKFDGQAVTVEMLNSVSLRDIKVRDILEHAQGEPLVTVFDSNPLSNLVEILAVGSHRAILYSGSNAQVSEDNHRHALIHSICSQSDIVRFLASQKDRDELKYMLDQNLTRLGYTTRDVVSINGSSSTVEAIRLLTSGHASKIAVTDAEGKLTGTFSAKVFRSIDSDGLSSICSTVDEFLALHGEEEKDLFIVSLQDTKFGDLLSEFTTRKVHHAWVTNENGQPSGIITLTDVMRAILDFKQSEEEKKTVESQGSKTILPSTGRLSIRIDNCSHLTKGSWTGSVPDSFVAVKFPGGKVHQTPVVKNSADPKFISSVTFDVLPQHINSVVVFEVWGTSSIWPDSFLGRYTLPIRWVLNGFGTSSELSTFKESFKLEGVDNGEVTLNLAYE